MPSRQDLFSATKNTTLGTYYLLACADDKAKVDKSDVVRGGRRSAQAGRIPRPPRRTRSEIAFHLGTFAER